MSPRKILLSPTEDVATSTAGLAADLGREVRFERRRREWTQRELAANAGVSASTIHRVEVGGAATLDGYARIASALSLQPRFTLLPEPEADPVPAGSAAATEPAVDIDPVHAALGEIEAARLSNRGFEVHLDEPYQHYQHAGRGDLVAFDRKHRALLHIENRTRFPDIQGFAGSYNAKRAYLAPELADRWQLGGGFSSQTHIVAALWSAEVLTTLRLREATFRALCPQSPEGFAAWWEGDPAAPTPRGSTSALVLLDPLDGGPGSARVWVGLDVVRTVEARYRGYAHALQVLRDRGLA